MEQDISRLNDVTNIPDNFPGTGNRSAGEGSPEGLMREQAATPSPSGTTTPAQGEDVVLFVEAISSPEQMDEVSPDDMILGAMDLEVGVPWYRSRWTYLGAGVVAATALSIGAVLLMRGLNRRNYRQAIGRGRNKLRRRSRLLIPLQTTSRMQGFLSQWSNQLVDRASGLTGQVQGRFSRLTHRPQEAAAAFAPLQHQGSTRNLWNRTGQQLARLSSQVSGQFNSLGVNSRTRAVQAIKGTQENLAELGKGMALGVEKTGESLKHSWKLGRNFTLGAVAGALWAMLFTPQSGETTRQHLTQTFQSRLRKD